MHKRKTSCFQKIRKFFSYISAHFSIGFLRYTVSDIFPDLQGSFLHLNFKDQRVCLFPYRICLRLLLPSPVSLYEPAVYHLLSFLSHPHSLIITFKASEIKPSPLKSDIYTEFSVFHPVYAPKTAGIVIPVFPLFKHLNTGAVDHMELA